MRNRCLFVLLVLLLATVVDCGSAFAASPKEMRTREELRAWYGKIIDTYDRKDIEGYMALYSQDAIFCDFQGNRKDRKELEALVKEDMAATGKFIRRSSRSTG